MSTNVNVNAPSAGLGDTIAKATAFLGIDTLWDGAQELFRDLGISMPVQEGDAECGGCERRRLLYNRLFPYRDSKRKVRFTKNHPIFRLDPETGEKNLHFMGIKDTVVMVDRKHPIYEMLLPLIYSQVIEEVR